MCVRNGNTMPSINVGAEKLREHQSWLNRHRRTSDINDKNCLLNPMQHLNSVQYSSMVYHRFLSSNLPCFFWRSPWFHFKPPSDVRLSSLLVTWLINVVFLSFVSRCILAPSWGFFFFFFFPYDTCGVARVNRVVVFCHSHRSSIRPFTKRRLK